MAKTLYTVNDKKMGTYYPPTSSDHLTQLTRALTEIVQSKADHNFCKYSEDYDLYEIGSFDEQTGKIGLLQDKKFILNLLELKAPPQPTDT